MRRCRLRAVCRRQCAKARTEQGNVKHLEEHTRKEMLISSLKRPIDDLGSLCDVDDI